MTKIFKLFFFYLILMMAVSACDRTTISYDSRPCDDAQQCIPGYECDLQSGLCKKVFTDDDPDPDPQASSVPGVGKFCAASGTMENTEYLLQYCFGPEEVTGDFAQNTTLIWEPGDLYWMDETP